MLYKRDYQQPFWRGLLHAVLVACYSMFLAIVLSSLERLFRGEIGVIVRLGFDLFLAVFSLAVCGYLIFFEPMRYAIHHHFKAASTMMAATLGWLLLFLVIFLVGLVETLGGNGGFLFMQSLW